jgi:hypothetical protein
MDKAQNCVGNNFLQRFYVCYELYKIKDKHLCLFFKFDVDYVEFLI